LIAPNAPILLQDLILVEREDFDRADFHTEETSFAVDFIPYYIESWYHGRISNLSDLSVLQKQHSSAKLSKFLPALLCHL
jgi:hypothetical protein